MKDKKARFEAMQKSLEKLIYEAEKSLRYHKDQAAIWRELIFKLQDEHYKLCGKYKTESI
jgi:hypothetical protein